MQRELAFYFVVTEDPARTNQHFLSPRLCRAWSPGTMTDSPVSRMGKRRTEAGPIGLKGMNSTWYLPQFVLNF